ncbi:MAG: class I SAM-dependent methyltransferase [Pseudomonadota bacterium]
MRLWDKVLASFLEKLVRHGRLRVVFPDGRTADFGQAGVAPVTLRLHDAQATRRLVLAPELALGEAYMEGALSVDKDDLTGLLCLLTANLACRKERSIDRWRRRLRYATRRFRQFNPARRAQRNVAHHYDLSDELYRLFLDGDRQYSCAYFRTPGDSLETAQEAKKELIARKLLLRPGLRVLDIGCGWGGLGLYLARQYGAAVTGITLSQEQLKIAIARAQDSAPPAAPAPCFRLQDYRAVDERFERIVSVGMFEHVGVPHYRQFFASLRERLTDDGIALVHTIGRVDGPGATNPWIAKYIFPGGYVPALSEVLPFIEQAGLTVTDIEVWRLHYAETLKAWRRRFMANRDKIRALYDERFCRMWHFYLAASEAAFRHGGHVVFQIQIARRQHDVPLTRDYLFTLGEGTLPAGKTA